MFQGFVGGSLGRGRGRFGGVVDFFGLGGGAVFLGVGLRGGGAPVVSIAIRPAAVHSMLLISIFYAGMCGLFGCGLCRRWRRWRLFFGVCVFFSTFSAFSVFSCVFGVFGAFGVFGVFGVFGACGAFGVFGIVSFGEWKFTFWLRPYPAHFLTACDDGICVLCYAVCFLRPGHMKMRASGS